MNSTWKLRAASWRTTQRKAAIQRERRKLKRVARRAARHAAKRLRQAGVPAYAEEYLQGRVSGKQQPYWLVPLGTTSFHGSDEFTRLYRNGHILLREISGGPRRLRRQDIRRLIKQLEVMPEELAER